MGIRTDTAPCVHAGPQGSPIAGWRAFLKRGLDLGVAVVGLVATGSLILACAAASAVAHGGNGFFVQRRVGRHGRTFPLVKIQTMRTAQADAGTVTTANDSRITSLGRFLRRAKLDELPQLVNVLLGHMSLVGPRPDVPGFADRLEGRDRIVLAVRPGITGPATLHYRNEEALLAEVDDPERYNREVVYPHKVALNRDYVERYSFRRDLGLIWRTLVGD